MPTLISQRALWHAVAITIVLHICDDIVTRYIWDDVVKSFVGAVPLAWWQDGNVDLTNNADLISDRDFFLQVVPRDLVVDLVIQVLAFYKACCLEHVLPTRSKPAEAGPTLPEKKDEEIRGREEMEQEIMQKLIADGRVKPIGIQWRNVLLRWLIDAILGTLVFGQIGYFLYTAVRNHSVGEPWPEYYPAIRNHFTNYWLSSRPLLSLVGHAFVPVVYRLQFWAATSLVVNFGLSLLLRPIVPWFMRLPSVKKFFDDGAAQNRLNQWWDREMKRHDEERKKLDAEMQEMFASWRTDADHAPTPDEL